MMTNSINPLTRDSINNVLKDDMVHYSIEAIRLCKYKPYVVLGKKDESTKELKELLQTKKVDVNFQNNNGESALICACKNGYTEAAKLLLQHPDIDVNVKDNDGDTILMNFAKRGGIDYCYQNTEILRLLLQHPNIDVNIQNSNGETALWIVCKSLFKLKVAKLLLKHPKIDVNIQNNDGITPLMIGFKISSDDNYLGSDNRKIIKLLLQRNDIDVNIQDNDGKTALNYAKAFVFEEKKLLKQRMKKSKDIELKPPPKNTLKNFIIKKLYV